MAWVNVGPIGYEDVKPYYDKVDKLIASLGNEKRDSNQRTGWAFSFHPQKPRLHELLIKQRNDKSIVT